MITLECLLLIIILSNLIFNLKLPRGRPTSARRNKRATYAYAFLYADATHNILLQI